MPPSTEYASQNAPTEKERATRTNVPASGTLFPAGGATHPGMVPSHIHGEQAGSIDAKPHQRAIQSIQDPENTGAGLPRDAAPLRRAITNLSDNIAKGQEATSTGHQRGSETALPRETGFAGGTGGGGRGKGPPFAGEYSAGDNQADGENGDETDGRNEKKGFDASSATRANYQETEPDSTGRGNRTHVPEDTDKTAIQQSAKAAGHSEPEQRSAAFRALVNSFEKPGFQRDLLQHVPNAERFVTAQLSQLPANEHTVLGALILDNLSLGIQPWDEMTQKTVGAVFSQLDLQGMGIEDLLDFRAKYFQTARKQRDMPVEQLSTDALLTIGTALIPQLIERDTDMRTAWDTITYGKGEQTISNKVAGIIRLLKGDKYIVPYRQELVLALTTKNMTPMQIHETTGIPSRAIASDLYALRNRRQLLDRGKRGHEPDPKVAQRRAEVLRLTVEEGMTPTQIQTTGISPMDVENDLYILRKQGLIPPDITSLTPDDNISKYVELITTIVTESSYYTDREKRQILKHATAEEFEKRLTNSEYILLQARDGKQLLGFLSARLINFIGLPDTPNIAWAGVRESHRGRGIARNLILSAEDIYRKAGHSQITCFIKDANVTSIEVFRKLGYQEAPITPIEAGPTGGRYYRKDLSEGD